MKLPHIISGLMSLLLICLSNINSYAQLSSTSTSPLSNNPKTIPNINSRINYSSQALPSYMTPSLKPAKKNSHNPLRPSHWQNHPDPYIEEGGVYTHIPHPALTQHQFLRKYSDTSSGAFLPPPSTVINPNENINQQPKVQITDPSGNIPAPPIRFP